MKCAIIPQGKQYPGCCSRRLSLEIKTNHLPVMLTSSFMVSFLQDISAPPSVHDRRVQGCSQHASYTRYTQHPNNEFRTDGDPVDLYKVLLTS